MPMLTLPTPRQSCWRCAVLGHTNVLSWRHHQGHKGVWGLCLGKHPHSLPAGILTPGSLLPAGAPVEVIPRPRPRIVAHLRVMLMLLLMLLLLLLLHLLLKAHGRYRVGHDRVRRERAIHGWGPHLHGDALLPRGHEAIWGWCHGHPWKSHGCSGVHARHAVHGVHGQARGEGRHGGTPRAHHGIWHPLHHLQAALNILG